MALLRIPLSSTRGTFFEYGGIQLHITPFRLNPYLGGDTWVVDLSWSEGDKTITIGGIALLMGIDIIQQYVAPIPNLLVLNKINFSSDATSADDINLYIKDNT